MRCTFTSIKSPTKVRAELRAAIAPLVLEAGHRAAREWQRSIPHKWPGQQGFVTGNTARSITVRQVRQLTVAVGTAAISGKALEEGAVPHIIKPRGAKRLAWPESRGGSTMPSDPPGWRVRRVAHHPGVQARFYGRNAVERQRAHLGAQIKAAIARIP